MSNREWAFSGITIALLFLAMLWGNAVATMIVSLDGLEISGPLCQPNLAQQDEL